MNIEGTVLEALEHPKFYHVGLLSKDVHKSIEQMRAVFPNLSHVSFLHPKSNHEDLIVGSDFELICANCRIGRIAFEFVQPVNCPDSYQAKALAERGEGFHHIAFVYPKDEFDAVIARMQESGYEIVFASKMGGGARRCYYLAPKDNHGMVFELLDGTALPIDY